MASTASLSPQGSYKTSAFVVILVGSTDHLDQRSHYYTDALFHRLREGNHPHRICVEVVKYCHGSPASVDPSQAGGHDEARILTDGTILGTSLDMAAFYGYGSITKMIDDFQKKPKQDPNEGFSFHLWHIAAGQHDDADVSSVRWYKWLSVLLGLKDRNVNLSMILPNHCLNFWQLFSAIPHTRIEPWFDTCPHHTVLLSGFVPPRAAVSFAVFAGNPSSLGAVPSNMSGVMALDSPPNPPAHGTRHMTANVWFGTSPIFQHTGSDVHTHVPATGPVPNLHEGPQASNPAAVQTLRHGPGAQGLAPTPLSVSPHESGVQQQPMLQDNTEAPSAGGGLANSSAGPTAPGEWTGRLYWNGVWIHARAQATEATGNLNLSAWPEDLQVEFVSAPEISTVDVQRLLGETEAPVVRLTCMDETDKPRFDQLVGALGYGRGYAVVKWENQGQTLERLLIVPIGKFLMCAAFLDVGIPRRPEHRPPPPVHQGPPKKKKGKTSPGSRVDSVTTPTSLEEQPEAAHSSTMTLPPPRQEQSSVACGPQDPTQVDPDPSSLLYQTVVFAQHQAMPPPQVQQVQRSRPVATPTSPVEPYVEAAQRFATPPQSPVAYGPQDSTQGGPNATSLLYQTVVFAQHQAMPPPQVHQVQRSRPVATPTSLEEPYVEAAPRMATPPQSPVAYGPQDSTQGGPNLSGPTDVPAQHQAMSLAQLRLELPARFQAQHDRQSVSPDAMGTDGELDDWRMDAGGAGSMAGSFGIDFGTDATGWGADSSFSGSSIASSEAMEGSDIMDWDAYYLPTVTEPRDDLFSGSFSVI